MLFNLFQVMCDRYDSCYSLAVASFSGPEMRDRSLLSFYYLRGHVFEFGILWFNFKFELCGHDCCGGQCDLCGDDDCSCGDYTC